MKKYLIPSLIAGVVLVASIIAGVLIVTNVNAPDTIISIDINPSIELKLKDGIVKEALARNEDAKAIINDDMNGKTFDVVFDLIAQRVVEYGYVVDNQLDIILYVDGEMTSEAVTYELNGAFADSGTALQIIEIAEVSDADRELANKLGVSQAKAAYLNSVADKYGEGVSLENLADRPVRELIDTMDRGKYCSEGYQLEGDWCIKEISRKAASTGEVCPQGYLEYNGTCYEEVMQYDTGELACRNNGFTLRDGNCYRVDTITADAAEYSCAKGELVIEEGNHARCADYSKAKKPTQRCLTINHTMINGKCADGPKPTINGGCVAGDYLVGGGCYTMDNGDQWVCPNGAIYHYSRGGVPKYCPDTVSYSKATVTAYKCPDGYTLDGKKCTQTFEEPPERLTACAAGGSKVNGNCVNLKKTTKKEHGYYCEDSRSRTVGADCVTYEWLEALSY